MVGLVLATGVRDFVPSFVSADLPGVHGVKAGLALLDLYQCYEGKNSFVLGTSARAVDFVTRAIAHGVKIAGMVEPGERFAAGEARQAQIAALGIPVHFGMAILSYYWQHYSDASLLEFVLGVMAFAYSGLIGVYGVALFTSRGTSISAIAAFGLGFLTVLAFQPYVIDLAGLPAALRGVAFPWQLVAGTLVAAAVCAVPSGKGVAQAATTG